MADFPVLDQKRFEAAVRMESTRVPGGSENCVSDQRPMGAAIDGLQKAARRGGQDRSVGVHRKRDVVQVVFSPGEWGRPPGTADIFGNEQSAAGSNCQA